MGLDSLKTYFATNDSLSGKHINISATYVTPMRINIFVISFVRTKSSEFAQEPHSTELESFPQGLM